MRFRFYLNSVAVGMTVILSDAWKVLSTIPTSVDLIKEPDSDRDEPSWDRLKDFTVLLLRTRSRLVLRVPWWWYYISLGWRSLSSQCLDFWGFVIVLPACWCWWWHVLVVFRRCMLCSGQSSSHVYAVAGNWLVPRIVPCVVSVLFSRRCCGSYRWLLFDYWTAWVEWWSTLAGVPFDVCATWLQEDRIQLKNAYTAVDWFQGEIFTAGANITVFAAGFYDYIVDVNGIADCVPCNISDEIQLLEHTVLEAKLNQVQDTCWIVNLTVTSSIAGGTDFAHAHYW